MHTSLLLSEREMAMPLSERTPKSANVQAGMIHSGGSSLGAPGATTAMTDNLGLSDFDCSASPMWIFDIRTLVFLAVNEAAVRHYGYSRERFLSMTILDIRPAEDIVPLLREELREGKHSSNKELWRHRKKDGSVIEVEITSHEAMFNGLPAEVVIVQDVAK